MHLVPENLRESPWPPKNFFIEGRELEDDFLGIAIVGTRRPTIQGISLAKETAKRIASLGIPVVSGLALGIDSAAHDGCLAAEGRTIAVLGSGLDHIYPEANRGLAKRIIEKGGSLISEYSCGVKPFKSNFLARNRIIAGLSSAVIVIEAPKRSGALCTAGYAAEAGREVLVFPGNVFHENYRGSHALIRDGARLISSFEDIIEDLRLKPPAPRRAENNPLPGFSKNEAAIMQLLKESTIPVPVDKIAFLLKIEPREIMGALTGLELEGMIIGSPEGYAPVRTL